MLRERLMWIAWPAFLMAAVLEMAVFAVLDPETIALFGQRLDWSRPAGEVHNHIRGLSPFPGAWCEVGEKKERVKVLRSSLAEGEGAPGTALDDRLTIACGAGAVRLTRLQRAGKKPAEAEEFLRGMRIAKGTVLA